MKHWPCLLIALCALHAAAAPATIVQGSRPPEAERFAASELQRYLKEVFDLSSDLTSQTPPETSGAPCFLIGTAADNPALRPFLGSALPTDPQAIILKKVRLGSRDAFVISGGSPEAVLWGVYDLFQRYGVTYLLQRDVVPHRAGEFYLPDLDLVLHPVLPTRSWRLVNAHAMGPESWDLKENEEVIDQLAKLKINRVYLSFWPWQSYNDFQYRGIAKTTGISFIGWPLPIDQDTIGRDLFGPVTHFENPGLAAARTYGERYDAARRLAHGIMARAKARGMEVGLEIQPLDFPTEFGAALTEAENTPIWWLGVTPGPDQPIDDPGLMDLVAADIRSYVTAYPEADLLYVEMPEFRQWSRIAEKAWASLDQRYHIGSLDKLASYVRAARNRTTYVHGDRAEAEVRGDLAGLYFLDRVIRERHVLHRAGEADIRLVYCDVSQELSSILPKLLPPGGEALMGIDYTASRVAGQPEAIAGVPAREMPTTLSYTLADDNVGILPQLATGSIAALNRLMETNAWAGYGNRFWIIGDLDPTASYLAESAWDDRVTPAVAYAQLIRGVCGPAAIGPLSRAWELIEEATRTLDQVSLSIAFPAPGMMLKFYHEGKPMPDALAGVQEKYRLALASARRAVDASRPSGRTFAGRFVGRLEFAVSYMEAIRLVSLAGSADKAGHEAEAGRDLAAALPPLRSAIESYAAVAEGDSDKGAIASLNDFAFRPLELQLSQVRVRLARGLAAMPATAADAMLSQARPGELMVGDYFDRIAVQAQLHRRAGASSPPDLSGLIARSLAIEIPAGVPRVKAQGDEDRSGYRVERVLVEPEAGIELPVLVLKPAGAGRRPAIIAVSKEGKFADTRPGSPLEAAARQGSVVIAADLRGTGETLPPAGRDGSREFAPAMEAILAGRTFLGTQVYDILRVAAYTASRPDVDSSKITLVGRGGPGVAALLAAALRTDFQKVIVENSVLSYLDLSQGKMDREMAELVVPGILGKFDLPDAAAAAGKSKIWLVNPKMPDGTPASESQIRREQGPEVHVILGTPPSCAELLRHDN